MIDLSTVDSIYICPQKVDMRKGIDGLAAVVQYQMYLNPFSKSIFIFCSRNKRTIKILVWDNNGFWIHTKKLLGKNRFRWPKPGESASLMIDRRQLKWLLDGLELEHKYAHESVRAIVENSL